jgi:hypothetical protein
VSVISRGREKRLIDRFLIYVTTTLSTIARRVERTIEVGPANINTGPGQKGAAIDRCLFSKPTYNAIGEPFKEAGKAMMRKENNEAMLKAGHERAFRPAKHVR